MRSATNELKLLLRSRYGLVFLPGDDPDRTTTLIEHVAEQFSLPVFTWTRARGLCRTGEKSGVFGTQRLDGALGHILASSFQAIYAIRATPELLDSPQIVSLLEEVARSQSDQTGGLIIHGPNVQIAPSLQGHAGLVELPEPSEKEYRQLLLHLVRDISKTQKIRVAITREQVNRLIQNLRGFTLLEAEKVLTKALIVDMALTEADIARVIEAKTQIVKQEGLLEYYPVESTLGDVAALDGLKAWLNKRAAIIHQPEKARKFGLVFPKGILLVGIPGTGKSLCAKAVAMEWSLPLLKMDPASLYNKYVGQTEENFSRAMRVAERMAPVVLWIDEIEKAFSSSGSDNDSGLSTRVLGTFLSWLQERSGDVFVVATANNVKRLPPELLRKGRFDEIFFVDLPNKDARFSLFDIHLKKRDLRPEDFDLEALANHSDGFTGADVEQVVLSALYTAFDQGIPIHTQHLLKEIAMTRPLIEIMPEKINSLRQWADGRTVPAN